MAKVSGPLYQSHRKRPDLSLSKFDLLTFTPSHSHLTQGLRLCTKGMSNRDFEQPCAEPDQEGTLAPLVWVAVPYVYSQRALYDRQQAVCVGASSPPTEAAADPSRSFLPPPASELFLDCSDIDLADSSQVSRLISFIRETVDADATAAAAAAAAAATATATAAAELCGEGRGAGRLLWRRGQGR